MKQNIDKALDEVAKLKRAAHEETKHLSGEAYFAYVRERVDKSLPFPVPRVRVRGIARAAQPRIAAEPAAEYRVKRAGKRKIRPPDLSACGHAQAEAVSHSKTFPGDRN